MKNFLSLEGLSHFLDNLFDVFVQTTDIVTNDEIDEICGSTISEESSPSSTVDGIAFVDETTNATYKLYVDNGKLHMTEVE